MELVRVDDSVDPFAQIKDEAVPEGVEILQERVHLGEDMVVVHYARASLREGESKQQVSERLLSWLRSIPLPEGTRFGIRGTSQMDPDTYAFRLDGIRSFVLSGEPFVRTEDVTDAVALLDEVIPAARLTLSSAAARRLEDATRQWRRRRVAVLVDGVIVTAPVVQTAVTGGSISVMMDEPDGDRKQQIDRLNQFVREMKAR